MCMNKMKLGIYSKNPLKVYGDLDILIQFGFHNIDAKYAYEILSKRLKKDELFQYYL